VFCKSAINSVFDDVVITKHTTSIIIGTDFERMVRNSEITTIVFTEIYTGLGIESRTRDALKIFVL
jgi:nicotinamidase-related amidase